MLWSRGARGFSLVRQRLSPSARTLSKTSQTVTERMREEPILGRQRDPDHVAVVAIGLYFAGRQKRRHRMIPTMPELPVNSTTSDLLLLVKTSE
jgi:hypothetical protein